jgi:hypothetical protein
MKKLSYIIPFLLALACTPAKHPAAMQVSLVNNDKSIQFKGLDYVVMQDIARDTNKDVWQSLVPVYRMPADTDMKTTNPSSRGIIC